MAFTQVKKISDSTLVNRLAYDSRHDMLLAEFHTGKTYYAENVPRHVYEELLMAAENDKASVGKLFLSMVMNHPDRPLVKPPQR